MPTKNQIKSVLGIVLAVGEAIRELKDVPSGHLYSHLMEKLTLDEYKLVITTLKEAELVKESNHLLTWIGPTK